MLDPHSDALKVEPRRSRQGAPGTTHVVAASLFLVAWLSFILFVALIRTPLPEESFVAAVQRATAHAPDLDP